MNIIVCGHTKDRNCDINVTVNPANEEKINFQMKVGENLISAHLIPQEARALASELLALVNNQSPLTSDEMIQKADYPVIEAVQSTPGLSGAIRLLRNHLEKKGFRTSLQQTCEAVRKLGMI